MAKAMTKVAVDILAELETYNLDPEAYELMMGGTPEELFPNEMAELDNWLNNVYSKF